MSRRALAGTVVLLLTVSGLLIARFARASVRAPVFDCIYTSTSKVTALAVTDHAVWVGTEGGCLRWEEGQAAPAKYTTQQGLPANRVTCLQAYAAAAPSTGAVILGTEQGAVGFAEQPDTEPANAGLPPLVGRVTAACQGKDGPEVALGRQVFEYSGGAWRQLGPPLPADVRCLAESSGSLWAGTARGLFRLAGESWEPVVYKDDPLAATVNALLPTPDALYVGTVGGLFTYAAGRWSALGIRDGLPENHVTSLADWRSDLYVGTYGGGVALVHDGRAQPVRESPKYVTCLGANAQSGPLWVGTESEGAFRWDGKAWEQRLALNEPPGHDVTGLAASGDEVFVGTFEHGVALCRSGSWQSPGMGLGSLWINHVAFGQGRAWARTSAGDLYVRDGAAWHPVTKQSGLTKDWTSYVGSAGGNIWVGTWGAVSKFDGRAWSSYVPKPALAGQVVTAVAVLGHDLWVGTGKGGLWRYDGGSRQWEGYSLGKGLTDTWVTCLAVWRNSLWVGTFSGGLCKWDGRNWEHLSAPAPLPSARINCLAATDCLYVGTLGGLCRFDGQSWTTYGRGEGLPSEIVQALCIAGDRLWVGTPEGLAAAGLVEVKEAGR